MNASAASRIVAEDRGTMSITARSPAPWAEVVPDRPPMTMEDFLDYPEGDEAYRYELVDGSLSEW